MGPKVLSCPANGVSTPVIAPAIVFFCRGHDNCPANHISLPPNRTDMPQNPPYARSIDALPLVFADGRWSFLY